MPFAPGTPVFEREEDAVPMTVLNDRVTGLLSEKWLIDRSRLGDAISRIEMAENLAATEPEWAAEEGEARLESVVSEFGVRVIPVKGVMISLNIPGWLCQLFNLCKTREVARLVAEADADPTVTDIVLAVDSPGGMVGGVDELGEAVRTCQTPIRAFASGMCCSAAYWAAAGCDSITATPTTTLGSIGVVVTLYGGYRPKSKLTMISSQTPRKRMDPFDEDSEKRTAARLEIQSQLDKLAGEFIGFVEQERPTGVAPLDGGVVIGQDAVDSSLADAIGYMQDVMRPAIRRNQMDEQAAETTTEQTLTVKTLLNTDAEPATPAPSEKDRVAAIVALPGSDAVKLECVAAGLSVEEAAKKLLDGGASHIEAREEHEAATDFPATHEKAPEGMEAEAAAVLATWKKYGGTVFTQHKT